MPDELGDIDQRAPTENTGVQRLLPAPEFEPVVGSRLLGGCCGRRTNGFDPPPANLGGLRCGMRLSQ